MKQLKLLICLFLVLPIYSCSTDDSELYKAFKTYKDGDLIFQRSQTHQSRAIEIATKSKFTHVGIIHKKENKYYVFEAGTKVQFRELGEWIKSGKGHKYAVKRLKSEFKISDLSRTKMSKVGEGFMGKPYDLYFDWADDKLYCSEFVYKVFYRGAGIKIGNLGTLRDFDLNHKAVKKLLKERYGDSVPYDSEVISPQAMYDSPKLITIHSDFD